MVLRKIKYSKIAVVVFLTILIWVWADLALDDKLPVSDATITVAKSSPSLWISFNDEPSVSIDNIVLRGPASKINNVRRRMKDLSPSFEFFLDAEQEKMTEPGEHQLDVHSFLRKSHQIKQFGLTVESCEPTKLTVNVVELAKRSLTVQCFDLTGNSLKTESIDPSKVDMFVPGDWAGEKLIAEVRLMPGEIERARTTYIDKIPFVELAPGQIKEAATGVKIKMSTEEDPLKSYPITTATLGYCLSANLQGKYKVAVDNLNEVIGNIAIRATPKAKQAYEDMRYQVILEIDDGDVPPKEPQRRVVYNFPQESVRKGEIMLDQQPVTARFKLIPQPSTEGQ